MLTYYSEVFWRIVLQTILTVSVHIAFWPGIHIDVIFCAQIPPEVSHWKWEYTHLSSGCISSSSAISPVLKWWKKNVQLYRFTSISRKKHTSLYQSLFNLMSIFSLSSLNFQSGCNGNLSVDFPMYLHFLFRFISLYLSLGKYVPVWCIFCLQKIIENLWLVYSSPSRTDSLVCLLKGNFLPNKCT